MDNNSEIEKQNTMHVLAELSSLRPQPEFKESQAFNNHYTPIEAKKNLLELPSFSIFEQQLRTLSNPQNYPLPFSHITSHVPPSNQTRELLTPQKSVLAQIAYVNNPPTFDTHENQHSTIQTNHDKQMRLVLEQKIKTLVSGLSSLFALKLPRMPDGTLHDTFDPLEVLKQVHESMNATTSHFSVSAPIIPKPVPRHPPHSGHNPLADNNTMKADHQGSLLSGLAALSSAMESKEDESEESEESPRHSFELQDTRDMRVWWAKYLQVKAIVDDFNLKQQLQQQQQQQQQSNSNNNGTHSNIPSIPTTIQKFPNMKDYPHLLNWMNEQVRLYHKGKLPESSHDLLKKLGFNFEIQRVGKNAIWTEYYERLLQIKHTTGSCEIPKDYKDDSLRRWVTNQRQNRKRKALSQSRIMLLDQVGFNWGSERKRKRDEPISAGPASTKPYETRTAEIGTKHPSDEEDEDYSDE